VELHGGTGRDLARPRRTRGLRSLLGQTVVVGPYRCDLA
jgi:hypothetical protein